MQFKITGYPANAAGLMNIQINRDAKGKEFESKEQAKEWAERWIERDIYMVHNRFQFDLTIEDLKK